MDKDNAPKISTMHQCMDCQNKVRLSRQETWKRSRPRCMRCGSTRLEPIEKNADK